jgi:hypothetical protein
MDNGTMVVRRGTATPDDNTARSVTVTTSVSATPNLFAEHSWQGDQIATASAGNICDFEIPYYYNERFLWTYAEGPSHESVGYIVNWRAQNSSTVTVQGSAVVEEREAVGEDYSSLFFIGVPPMWVI